MSASFHVIFPHSTPLGSDFCRSSSCAMHNSWFRYSMSFHCVFLSSPNSSIGCQFNRLILLTVIAIQLINGLSVHYSCLISNVLGHFSC